MSNGATQTLRQAVQCWSDMAVKPKCRAPIHITPALNTANAMLCEELYALAHATLGGCRHLLHEFPDAGDLVTSMASRSAYPH